MANVEKLMKDMEKASGKLADMLNEKEEPIPETESEFSTEIEELDDGREITEIDETAQRSDEVDCEYESGKKPQPCSRIVRFHCVRGIPKGLELGSVDDFRVVYDPTALRVCVEEADISVTPPPGCPDLTLTVFAIRVTGCIPVNSSVLAFESRCGANLVPRQTRADKVALCCHTIACVDNVICYRGTRQQAEIAAAKIQRQLRAKRCRDSMASEVNVDEASVKHKKDPCNVVPLLFATCRMFRVPTGPQGGKSKVLVFSGAFKLPSCPKVTAIN